MRVNLGCGRDVRPGWINLDSQPINGAIHQDLDSPSWWKFPPEISGVTYWHCSHLLEHIRHPLQLLQAMWEASGPNAKATFRVPHGSSDAAWEDPTHVRPIFAHSFGYFSQPFYWRADYGYRGDWNIDKVIYLLDGKTHGWPESVKIVPSEDRVRTVQRISHERNWVAEMVVEMTAVHPARAPRPDLAKPYETVIQIVHG